MLKIRDKNPFLSLLFLDHMLQKASKFSLCFFEMYVVESLSRVGLFATPRAAARLLSLSCTGSWGVLRLVSIEWCHPAISPSAVPFSCPQSFPASGSFPISWLLASAGQSTGASISASVLPMNIQGWWFPLGWTGLISLLSKGLSSLLHHHNSCKTF